MVHHGELDLLKGQFLASVNHEIRTPLTGILGMTDLLLETPLDGEQQEYVSAARTCATQLMEMLNSILEYSSLSSGQTHMEESEFHLVQTLEIAAADFLQRAQDKGLHYVCRFDDQLPDYVYGDAVRLRQLLRYILSNSLKFTEKGEIELSAHTGAILDDHTMLTVTVRDTGIGIPREKLGLIFHSFRQLENGLARTYDGLGLGLALAEKLVRLMGGGITAVSEPGSGSTFTVRIPVKLPAADGSSEIAAPTASAAAAGESRILVVEDSVIAQRIVGHILGKAGYNVDFADGGTEAIEAAAVSHYGLILMDLQMPGVDGLAATTAIRQLPGYLETPIVALTANYSNEHRQFCQDLGMQGFLAKPVHREELLAAVSHFLK